MGVLWVESHCSLHQLVERESLNQGPLFWTWDTGSVLAETWGSAASFPHIQRVPP